MPKKPEYEFFASRTRTISIFTIALIAILGFAVLYPLWDVIFVAAILSYVLRPLRSRLQKTMGTFLSCLVPVFLVLFFLFIPFLVFVQFLNLTIPTIKGMLNGSAIGNIFAVISPVVPAETIQVSLFNFLESWFTSFLTKISDVIIDMFVLVVLLFYFLKEGDKIKEYFFNLLPPRHNKFAKAFLKLAEMNLKVVILGHFMTSIIIALVAIAGMYLLGAPHIILLSIIMLFIGIIPVFGTWIVLMPLAFYSAGTGDYMTATLYILLSIFNSTVDDIYVRPKLVGRLADVHPALILIGFFSGLTLFGLTGIILGPLLMVILKAVVDAYKETAKQ